MKIINKCSIFLGLLLCLCLCLCSCGNKDTGVADKLTSLLKDPTSKTQSESKGGPATPEKKTASSADDKTPTMENAKGIEWPDDALCAAAFLGYGEDILSLAAEHENARNIMLDHYIYSEGNEVYLIVPRHPDSTVTVQAISIDWDDNYKEIIGDTLYKSGGEPFVLRCNLGDEPSTMITIKHKRQEVIFYPFIDMMGGGVMLPGIGGVIDISIREDNGMFSEWSGWSAIIKGKDSQSVELRLEFFPGGQVSYAWTRGDGDSFESLIMWGKHTFKDGELELNMTNFETDESFYTVYNIEDMADGGIMLSHMEGDSLYNGYEDAIIFNRNTD